MRDNSKVDTHLRGLLHSSPPSGTCGSRSVAQGDVTAPGMFPLAGLLPQGSLSSCGITLPSMPGPSRWCHHSSKEAVMEGESCLHCCQKQRVTGLHNPPATIFLSFLVKKQYIKVGLSPVPRDPFTSRPVLTPLGATSLSLLPVPLQASTAGTDRIHGSSQDLGWLRWWDRALPHSHHPSASHR